MKTKIHKTIILTNILYELETLDVRAVKVFGTKKAALREAP